ncbi:helix-turn-helix domain-containing protein [Mucilaginibacter sp. UR6-1]|uniref:helix-turn-helix domain-containing protein n=1 Tax=Mucilaginibacter sp. UR6-1 TaxID=1435643 RepID=UPI001E5989D9|nr:helix-turn-helix domain-containing protein [Mucilaginibacter sp. UR6-1]MCC8410989.1 helix-turn-helix domain-containing protein [Mucilaginibacter sp. UR6-1]
MINNLKTKHDKLIFMPSPIEAKGIAIPFQTEFGTLITSFLLHINNSIEQCVTNAVRNALVELKQESAHQKNEELEAGFITRAEAVKFLKISYPTLHRYQKAGLLPYHKIGRKVYFKQADLISATKVKMKGVRS